MPPGHVHARVYANSAPRSSGPARPCPRSRCSDLAPGEGRPQSPRLAAGLSGRAEPAEPTRGARGPGSRRAGRPVNARRRRARITEAPRAAREAGAGLRPHGAPRVAVTLAPAPSPCWRRLPRSAAGTRPGCRGNGRGRYRSKPRPLGAAAKSATRTRPSAPHRLGGPQPAGTGVRTGGWALPVAGEPPRSPGLSGSAHAPDTRARAALPCGPEAGARARGAGLWDQQDWVQVQALAPTSHPTAKRAPYPSPRVITAVRRENTVKGGAWRMPSAPCVPAGEGRR